MKKLLCTISLAALALSARAATETAQTPSPSAPAQTAAATETAAAPAAIEIKNKSSFEIPDNGRNPFWPIGWKPTPKAPNSTGTAAEPAGPEVQANAFVVSSIVMDPRARFAIINGKVMNEGQVFGLQLGSSTYQMTVKAIQDGQVILVRGRDQEIVVPLRRR
jgi:hypothetical protein